MYDDFYRLNKRPFQLCPDPEFYFNSDIHNKAMLYMRYGLSQGEGFIVITGTPGTGKTLLIKQLVNNLKVGDVITGVIVSSQLDADNLLRTIAAIFKLDHAGLDKTSLLLALERFFIDQAMQGKKVLMIIDEAHNLPCGALEELRMLSNFEIAGKPLFQAFLVGQTQLADRLAAPEMEQLRQRIAASCQLKPLAEADTKQYIFHRLQTAGWRQRPQFADDAFAPIQAYSQGIPRKINTLCDRILLFGYIAELQLIDDQVVRQVIDDIKEEGMWTDDLEAAAPPSPGHGLDGALERRVAAIETVLAKLAAVLSGGASTAPESPS